MAPPQARPARKADLHELSATLSRAFFDDPVMAWIFPNSMTRTTHLTRMFSAMTRHHHLPRGGVEVAHDGPVIGAAALWGPANPRTESPPGPFAIAPRC